MRARLAADWQDGYLPRLDTLPGRLAIEPFVAQADFIILDNRSSLFDPEAEKDPTAWQPAQDSLLSLRRRRKAVLIVHHSNRMGGARGHSKPEDVMELLIKLTRPEGYRFNLPVLVSRYPPLRGIPVPVVKTDAEHSREGPAGASRIQGRYFRLQPLIRQPEHPMVQAAVHMHLHEFHRLGWRVAGFCCERPEIDQRGTAKRAVHRNVRVLRIVRIEQSHLTMTRTNRVVALDGREIN